MYRNFIFKDSTEALPSLLESLHVHGEEVGSRAGRVKELTHVGITLTKPWNRELLVEARKPNLAAQIAETMWVLAGRNDIDFLSKYLPRAGDFSDDGKTWRAGYGTRLRRWPAVEEPEPVDQLRSVFELLKRDPLSRQAVASIWDPTLDYQSSKDIPCNNWLSFSSRLGKLDLHVAIRSNDAMWGWSGINAFEWSALQEILAGLLGLHIGGLHFSTTSFHLYEQHWSKGRKITDASAMTVKPQPPKDSPWFKVHERDAARYVDNLDWFDQCVIDWLAIEEGIRAGRNMDEAVNLFPEPMLQSWLRVIQWWWSSEREYLAPLEGTRLEVATHYSVQPPKRETVEVFSGHSPDPVARFSTPTHPQPSAFLEQLCTLHLEKEAAYGGSWKKRGELFSILPNVGRKIDRLGNGETDDETQADTAGDLFVYLAKYRTWLNDQHVGTPLSKLTDLSESAHHANTFMGRIEEVMGGQPEPTQLEWVENGLKTGFEQLLALAEAKDPRRAEIVDAMAKDAYRLARARWEAAQDDYRGADHE